jgi:hypothetical protein
MVSATQRTYTVAEFAIEPPVVAVARVGVGVVPSRVLPLPPRMTFSSYSMRD